MSTELSHILNTWIWIIGALVIVIVILRFFLHAVVHLIQLAFRFFWHILLIAVLLFAAYYILHLLNII
jgi:hypothetical protein